MENSHLKKSHQSSEKAPKPPTTHVGYEKPKAGSALQVKVRKKNEIKLSCYQLDELARLFKDYGIKKPGWLRQKFLIDQRRRKRLNCVLFEAGCDASACDTFIPGDDWSSALHVAWHLINEKPICRQ